MVKRQWQSAETDCFQWFFLHPKYWLTWLGLMLTALLSLLPFSWMLALGRLLGRLFYLSGGRRVHIARTNLQRCFPDKSDNALKVLLKSNFESVGIGVMEVLMAWWWPVKRLERKVCFEGLEHLKNNRGQGTILMVLHFTTIEIAGAMITLRHNLHATYRAHKNPVFEYMQRRQRLRYGADNPSRLLGRRDIRGMLRILRAGETIWYSPDQDYGAKQSVFAPFFGVQAATVTGTSRLARISNARVVPMTLIRLPGTQGYVMKIHPPLEGFPGNDDKTDAARVNRFIEGQVREHPEQYMWLHRRFKTRPEGEGTFYRRK